MKIATYNIWNSNCGEHSSVHQYLRGDTSLHGTEVKTYWTDLACVAEEWLGVRKELTLNLKTNPRWKGQTVTDNSTRVDCIFMHDCFPRECPILKTLSTFGKAISEAPGLCASDHYGVYVDLQMPYEKQ